MPRFSRFFTLFFTALSATALPALAQDQDTIDWKQGKWGRLASHIGTYQYGEVLNDAEVSKKLEDALGTEKKHLIDNLAVHDPIGFENDCLVLSGNGEKKGSFERAYLNVCLYAGTINAAILSDDKIVVYTSMKDYQYLPDSLREWVYQVKNPEAFSAKPDNVQLMTIPE